MGLEKYLVPGKPKGRKQNPCAECQRPIARCPWLRSGEPVPGWTAVRAYIPRNRAFAWTWNITACPGYLPPSPERMELQEAEEQVEREEQKQKKSRASYRTFY